MKNGTPKRTSTLDRTYLIVGKPLTIGYYFKWWLLQIVVGIAGNAILSQLSAFAALNYGWIVLLASMLLFGQFCRDFNWRRREQLRGEPD